METEVINQKKDKIKFVRIMIGMSETGKRGIQAPTKTICIKGISVQDVYKRLFEMYNNGEKN